MHTRARHRPSSILREDRHARALLAAAISADAVATVALIGALAAIASVVAAVFIDQRDLAAVTTRLAIALACFTARAGATAGADLFAARASAHLRTTLRADLLARLARHSRVGGTRATGALATMLTDRIEALDGYVTQYARAAAMCVIGPAIVFVVISVLDPLCLLVLTFTGPMLVVLLAVIGARTKSLAEAREAELGWLHAFFLDMVTGLGTLKAFGRDAEGATTIEDVSRRHGHAAMEVLRTAFQTSLVMEWAATAATALVAVIVSMRLINDSLSFVIALTALVITPEFFLPFRRLAAAYHAGADGKAAIGAIGELRTELPIADVAQPGPSSVQANRSIRFEQVTARYPGQDRDAALPFSCTIAAGEIVALTGPSGSGKTTITRLLLGLLAPHSGSITIGDDPLDAIDLRVWHRNIAWVSQHPTIIAGTVADNVRLGCPDASDAELTTALAAADATAFITDLPDGVLTVLDEGGRSLSAGQRQRLAIARALLRDAPVVILDECTAHLDADSEQAVIGSLRTLLARKTALIVSHRDAAIALADRVVALDALEVPA